MQKYRCIVCNYIYDPAVGDIERGVSSGTPFVVVEINVGLYS